VNLYQNSIQNLGFIILSPEPNLGRLKSTHNSVIKNYGVNTSVICIVPENIQEDLDEYKKICSTYTGKNTITSLINKGFFNATNSWNMLLMEGTWVKSNIDKKYSKFMKSDKDILFPVVCDYDLQGMPSKIYKEFWNCSLNGLMIHKKTFLEIGYLSDDDLEESRLMWHLIAEKAGCEFKSILGAKIC